MKLHQNVSPAARLLAPAASVGLAMLLSGCAGYSTTATPSPTAGFAMSGNVHGGQQPVSGANIYLLGASTGGYGGTSRTLLGTGPGIQANQYGSNYATTDANGNFAFSNFTCPTPTTQVYLLAQAGNPGLAAGTSNGAIMEMAAIGNCSNITTSSFFNINEVTTAAFVLATQQFMSSSIAVSSPTTNTIGLANAFALAQDLANTTTGQARTTNTAGTGTVPQAKLNSLGNIIAPCVNSASNQSTACTSLFAAVTPSGGTKPNEVAGALLLIAQNPGNNVAAINGQSNAAAPFQPSLTAAPNDFTVGITYRGGGMTAPGVVVIDANGNAYVTNSPSTAQPVVAGTDSIVGFSPTGVILTGANGYTTNIHAPGGLAIGPQGNIWSNNSASGNNPDQLVKMTAAGAVVFAVSDPSLSGPQGIAIDANSNAWVASQNNSSLVQFSTTGTRSQVVTSNGFVAPTGVGIDSNGSVFAAGTGSNTILKVSSTGALQSPAGGYTSPTLNQPTGISVDNAGNVWTSNNVGSTLTKITNNGVTITPTGPTPQIANTYVVALDGVGSAWLANCRAACGANTTAPDNLIHVGSNQAQMTGTADGYQNTNLSRVGTSAVDGSGNVWVTSNGNGSVTEFIGVAAPVVTPLAVAVATNKVAVRP